MLYIVWVVKTIFVRYDASCGLSSDHIQWWKICWRLESCVLLRDEESHGLPVFLCDACYWSFHHGPYKWWYLVVNNLRQNLNRWWCNSGFPMSSNIDCTIVFVWGYMRTHRVTIFSFVTCESYELFSCVCNLFYLCQYGFMCLYVQLSTTVRWSWLFWLWKHLRSKEIREVFNDNWLATHDDGVWPKKLSQAS